ncbi:hypothetical protein Dsin_028107 [Dipteronia sinensis]|uniref:Endonuclease/exonuclease/phosphatase domain-containing protein n=1 Tax=Dipteronia sinensis TaxID=43782 RepID=A0AAE0DU82_9ROSI|nr:hypothetical protein Dsin_028107 [Dipteronia sinensis]
MIIFVWNACGLNSPRAFNILQNHKRDSNPDIMFLMETRCKQAKLETWRSKLGFDGKLVVDSVGNSGGLCLFWSNAVEVDLLSYSSGHIDVRVRQCSKPIWRFSGFYGNPVPTQRKHYWTLLRRLAGMCNLPWLCIGDFNEILYESEKVGGLKKSWQQMSEFREALDDCSLEDMGFVGPAYTWCNKREGTEMILERLGRGICSHEWRLAFPHSVITHMEFWGSDHRSLVLEAMDSSMGAKVGLKNTNKRFYFEECWAQDHECQDIVNNSWLVDTGGNNTDVILKNIGSCGMQLKAWNILKRRNLRQDIRKTKGCPPRGLSICETRFLEGNYCPRTST